MKARHRAAKGTKYSYEDHYEDDDDYLESYDESFSASQEAHLIRPDSFDNHNVSNQQDDSDILDISLAQICDYFQGQVKFDEDSVVEYLRSNGYNVDEAIDFIWESGSKNPLASQCVREPKANSISYPSVTKPYTSVQESNNLCFFQQKDTLASVICKTVPISGNSSSVNTKKNCYSIETDVLPRMIYYIILKKETQVFDFKSLSPDDLVKKMQAEGKTHTDMNKSIATSHLFHPIEMKIEVNQTARAVTPFRSHTPPPAVIATTTPVILSPKSPKKSPKSPKTPVEEIEPELLRSPPAIIDGKDMITAVIAGHVDHGKSTITGQLSCLFNVTNDRELRKLSKEAKERGKQSNNYAFVMDRNEEERVHGITIDLGVISLETDRRYITLLDSPGHRDFINAMISGGVQADCGVLVVSAHKGEFEAGMSSAGITREHLLIFSSNNIESVAVAVNKMDSCSYSRDRFDEIVSTLSPYMRHLGYKRSNVLFIPVSGLEGVNLTTINHSKCPWYDGPSLIDFLNTVKSPEYDASLQNTRDVVIAVNDVFHGEYQGDCVAGRVVKGFLDMNTTRSMVILPTKQPCSIRNVLINNKRAQTACLNTNVTLCLNNADLNSISKGNIITTANNCFEATNRFIAQLYVNDVISMPIVKGLTVVLYLAGNIVTAVINHVYAQTDYIGKVLNNKPKIIKGGMWASVGFSLDKALFVAPFSVIPSLGRFIIRDEGVTLGIGRITELKAAKFHKL